MITYPLNNIDYTAEDAELFHCTRASGIYDGDAFAVTVTGVDNNITIGPGVGWIQNTQFSGKVVANKDNTVVTPELADSVSPRIDAVVIRFDANANGTSVVMKTGVPSSSPVAPEVVRTETVYELHLCHVYREAGVAVVTESDITDLRYDAEYCGIMLDPISSVDSTFKKKGFAADSKAVGDALAMKAETASYKTTFPASGWSSNAPFTQSVTIEGLLETDEPFVDVYLENVENGTEILEAWMLVGRLYVSANNTLTVCCYEEKPTVDIPIILKVVR